MSVTNTNTTSGLRAAGKPRTMMQTDLSGNRHAVYSAKEHFVNDGTQKNYELSMSEVRTLSLASIGGALEFYDFIIFVFFADVIGKVFSLPL